MDLAGDILVACFKLSHFLFTFSSSAGFLKLSTKSLSYGTVVLSWLQFVFLFFLQKRAASHIPVL